MNKRDETILHFAARYTYTRQTSAAYVVMTKLEEVWDELSPSMKDALKREVNNEATANRADWDDFFKQRQ